MSLLTLDIFNKKDPYFLKKTKLFEKIFLQKQLVLGTYYLLIISRKYLPTFRLKDRHKIGMEAWNGFRPYIKITYASSR